MKVKFIKNVKEEDIYNNIYGKDFSISMKILLSVPREKSKVYRAFDPLRLQILMENGTDRTPDYISSYEKNASKDENVIYAGDINKALEYAVKHFRKYGLACIAAYDEDKLEKIDFYTYKPKNGNTFKDALLGVVCLEE